MILLLQYNCHLLRLWYFHAHVSPIDERIHTVNHCEYLCKPRHRRGLSPRSQVVLCVDANYRVCWFSHPGAPALLAVAIHLSAPKAIAESDHAAQPAEQQTIRDGLGIDVKLTKRVRIGERIPLSVKTEHDGPRSTRKISLGHSVQCRVIGSRYYEGTQGYLRWGLAVGRTNIRISTPNPLPVGKHQGRIVVRFCPDGIVRR